MGQRGLGEHFLNRGEIRWYTFRHPDKRRPVLILTRDEVIERLNQTIVVPVTRTIRGLSTEVVLTPEDSGHEGGNAVVDAIRTVGRLRS